VIIAGLPCCAETLAERLPACLACHGEQGTSNNPEVPSLGGQPVPYMEIQLYLFREKMRPIEVMIDAMKGVANEDLVGLAKLIARLPAPKPAPPGEPNRMRRGQSLIHQHRCNFCHTTNLSGQNNVPRIADQREDYLVKALREYKSNARPGYDASMADVVAPLTDQDILDLAYFAARQP
jgi:cytochrome c553